VVPHPPSSSSSLFLSSFFHLLFSSSPQSTFTPSAPQCLSTPIVRIGTPPPSSASDCVPLETKRGVHSRQLVRGCGGPNWDAWRNSLALCTPPPGSHSFLLSHSSLHPKESVTHRRQAKLHCVLKVTYCTTGRYDRGTCCSL